MNYIDLFAGIGGFALGAYWAGWRFDKHYFSEVDPYAVKLYKKRFPDAIPLGDVRKIDTAKLADAETLQRTMIERSKQNGILQTNEWIITGGFPCQDISVAGKGAGIRGSRSGLWFEMWRIIRDLRPRWVIAENVGAFTFRGLAVVVNSLAQIGFDAEWQDIRAEDVGAPHRRERIWIVAYPRSERAGHNGRSLTDQGWPTGEDRRESIRQRDGTIGSGGLTTASEDVAYSFGNGRREEWTRQSAAPSEDVANTDRQRLAQWQGQDSGGERQNSESISSRNEWWAVEPDVGRVAHGIPSRVDRLKGLGNSIIPQIAEILFRRIKAENA